MYVQNRVFSDTETLLEVLFDLELGVATPELEALYKSAGETLAGDAGHQTALAALTDEEDRLEAADETRREVVAALLQDTFSDFKVEDRKLWGLNAAGTPVLLAAIDLV